MVAAMNVRPSVVLPRSSTRIRSEFFEKLEIGNDFRPVEQLAIRAHRMAEMIFRSWDCRG